MKLSIKFFSIIFAVIALVSCGGNDSISNTSIKETPPPNQDSINKVKATSAEKAKAAERKADSLALVEFSARIAADSTAMAEKVSKMPRLFGTDPKWETFKKDSLAKWEGSIEGAVLFHMQKFLASSAAEGNPGELPFRTFTDLSQEKRDYKNAWAGSGTYDAGNPFMHKALGLIGKTSGYRKAFANWVINSIPSQMGEKPITNDQKDALLISVSRLELYLQRLISSETLPGKYTFPGTYKEMGPDGKMMSKQKTITLVNSTFKQRENAWYQYNFSKFAYFDHFYRESSERQAQARIYRNCIKMGISFEEMLQYLRAARTKIEALKVTEPQPASETGT